jgi:hypothetical protein
LGGNKCSSVVERATVCLTLADEWSEWYVELPVALGALGSIVSNPETMPPACSFPIRTVQMSGINLVLRLIR